MNQKKFELEKRRVMSLLDNNAYRNIDGVIRWSLAESWPHFLAKCKIVRALKQGQSPDFIRSTYEVADVDTPTKFKSWESPLVITEARFSSRLRTDILVVSIEGTFAIEIAESESEASIKKKTRAYSNMQIQFIEVRI